MCGTVAVGRLRPLRSLCRMDVRVMNETCLLHDLVTRAAVRSPDALALTDGARHLPYGELHAMQRDCARGLLSLGLQRGERVAIFLEKRVETVVACFGASAAGAVFVPVNPILRAMQVLKSDPQILVKEQARARYIRAEMEKLGLTDIREDKMLNISGVRKGTGGGPTVVFAAQSPLARMWTRAGTFFTGDPASSFARIPPR